MPTGEEVTIEGERITPDRQKITLPSGEVVVNEPEQTIQEIIDLLYLVINSGEDTL